MRIGMVIRSLRDDSLRGFNRYTFNLVRQLQGQDDIQLVLYTDPASPLHAAYRASLTLKVVEVRAPKVFLWEQLALPAAARRDAVDVLHVPTDYGLPWSRRVPLVFTYHSATDAGLRHMIRSGILQGELGQFFETPIAPLPVQLWRRWRHDVSRWLSLRRAHRVITVSDFAAGELIHLLGIRAEKIRVIHEAPDESFRADLPIDAITRVRERFGIQRPYLLYVSGFDRHKNVSGLLESYAGLRRQLSSYCLVLAGIGGDIEGARATARRLGLAEQDDVFFLTRVQDDLPALYRGASLMVTLTWRESFCFPVVEAMASGTPVVASRFGAIPEVAGDAAVLVDPRDVSGVVRALVGLLHAPDRLADLSARGRRRVEQFTWEKTAAATAAVYRELVGA